MPRSRNPLLLLSLVVLPLWIAPAARAAKPMPPPLEVLTRGRNQVALMEVAAKAEAPRVRFVKREDLWGETPEELTARTSPEAWQELEPGQVVVLGWSDIRKNPLLRDVLEEDPDGPRVLKLPGIGPALFEDSAEVRYLVTTWRQPDPEPAAKVLAAVLAQMRRPVQRSRQLAVMELFTRKDLQEAFDDASLRALRDILSAELTPETRDFLLKTVLFLPQRWHGAWMAEAARQALAGVGAQLDLNSMMPSLVITSLHVLQRTGRAADAEPIRHLLVSNNPGVGKAALRTLDVLDPKIARAEGRKAMAGSELHAETRRVLEIYLAEAKGEAESPAQ